MYRLYTHNDLDGVGCGIVAKLAFGEKIDIRYNSVSGLDFQISRFLERGKEDDILFVTDLSVNEENEKGINDFFKRGGKVTLIDHHKTALHFNEYEWGKVQVSYDDGRLTSATSLFYEYLIHHQYIRPTQSIDRFVELVRQYDTWEWDKNENLQAKRLNDLFFMLSIDDFEERMVERLKESNAFHFDDFEEKILDMEEDKIERYVRKKRREMVQHFIGDFCVGIVHAESYHSELGNELGKDNPHLDYIAILNLGGKRMSFRTIHDEVDVSAVANYFGGGGHAKASGCSLTEEAYRKYVADAFPLEPIKLDAFKNKYNLKEGSNGTLYCSNNDDKFYVFKGRHQWLIEHNGVIIEQPFDSFWEAERYLKRNHSAWLVRDELFIEFLMETVYQAKKSENEHISSSSFHSQESDSVQQSYSH